jgi:hypothetical protein
MIENCEREVIELHQFFEAWFNGTISGNSAFHRMEIALAPSFKIIPPSGKCVSRHDTLTGVKSAHGALAQADPPFRIWIKNFQLRHQESELCLVTYEEWQAKQDGDEGRISTALFKNRSETPNGVEWLHLHEVWIQTQ